ncbi:MAG: hypothetical protein XXXJIFNMEKO3_03009 [Candidatus Erwinia impunctatus]|nr:hypothetical protein XXXJIFNMEKO_03009 [Culicoides impunctatus]
MKVSFLLALAFSLMIPKLSFALNCYAYVNNSYVTSETVKVDDIVIPESAQNGQVIWSSPQYERKVKCDNAYIKEYVYFYPFPRVDYSTLPAGMSFGIIYNGTDYPLSSTTEKIKTDIEVPKNGSKEGTINVQVYIKKTGNISGGFKSDLPVYQLDGVGGLNTSSGAKNFKFSLSNLSSIATGKCSYSFNSASETNEISINDDLISSGKIISAVGTASISCTPVDMLKNKTVKMNLYTNSSSTDSLFKTGKDGLGYQLLISGGVISPSVTSSSPLVVNYSLDENGKGSKTFGQKVFLTSIDEDWIYQNDTSTVESNKPNLGMSVSSFE